MKTLYIVAYFIVIINFYYCLRTILAIILRKEYIRKINKYAKKMEDAKIKNVDKDNKKEKTIDAKFVVMLPALREQSIIEETINHFSSLKETNKLHEIFIVTTEREEEEYRKQGKDTITTGSLADKLIVEANKKAGRQLFKHVHSPIINGNKSTQLNVATCAYIKSLNITKENIEEVFEEIKRTYICVFDFDARPKEDSLLISNVVANMKNFPDAMCQVPCSFKNFSDKTLDIKNTFIVLQGVYQTVRCYGIEMFRLILSTIGLRKLFPMYVMGAGMQIRLDSLITNDMFPRFVDDITLGYRLSLNKARFAYIPSDCFVELPEKTIMLFNQAVLIFKGVLTSFSEIERNILNKNIDRNKNENEINNEISNGNTLNTFDEIKIKVEEEKEKLINKKSILEILKMTYEGIMSTIPKTIEPYLMISILIYELCIKKIDMLFYLILLVPYVWFIAGYIAVLDEKVKAKNYLTIIFAFVTSPIYFIFNTFGGIIYIKRLIISLFKGEKVTYKKTER